MIHGWIYENLVTDIGSQFNLGMLIPGVLIGYLYYYQPAFLIVCYGPFIAFLLLQWLFRLSSFRAMIFLYLALIIVIQLAFGMHYFGESKDRAYQIILASTNLIVMITFVPLFVRLKSNLKKS